MGLAAGLFSALAMAASAAGEFLLLGILFAVISVACARQVPAEPQGRALRGLRAATLLGLLVVYATVFTAYVLPDSPGLGAVGFVAVVTVLHTLGLRVNTSWRRWLTAALLCAAAVFVAVAVAVPSPPSTTADTEISGTGILLAGAVLFPLLDRVRRGRLVLAAVVTFVVAWAALRQLGAFRLGLAPTSLHDVLVAADAAALETMLVILVVLTTGSAAVQALTEVQEILGQWRGTGRIQSSRGAPLESVMPGVVAAPVAAVLGPSGALLVAAALSLSGTIAHMVSGPKRLYPTGIGMILSLTLAGALVVHVVQPV